jgi:hypothetical protein
MTAGGPADEFLRLGCLYYEDDQPERWAQARRVLAAHPGITRLSVHAAAAAADVPRLRAHLAGDRAAASRPGGPFRCEPLFYLAYTRHDPAIGLDAVLTSARLLLGAGADPNAGYLWHGLPTPFTVLTGVFGEGELGPVRQPRHPHSRALARLLLEAGADPNDGQALYNRMFEPGNDHLELLFEFGLGTGDGGPWRARLGAALDTPEQLVRGQLRWAITHGMTERVLARAVRAARPALIVWAAAQGQPGSVELLAGLGFDVNAKGRSDVPAEQPWQAADRRGRAGRRPRIRPMIRPNGAGSPGRETPSPRWRHRGSRTGTAGPRPSSRAGAPGRRRSGPSPPRWPPRPRCPAR